MYLYLGSVAFVIAMYTTLLRDKALEKMMVKHAKYKSSYSHVECQQLTLQVSEKLKNSARRD